MAANVIPCVGGTITGTKKADIIDCSGASTGVTVSGGGGNDIIYGSPNADIISGGASNDIIYGGGGDDNLCGGVCDSPAASLSPLDRITALGSVTFTRGGFEDLTPLFAPRPCVPDDPRGRCNDGGGNDTKGGSGNDKSWGEGGNHADLLYGDDGADILEGSHHNDALDGGAGTDVCDGGADTDVDEASASCESISNVP